MSTFLALRGALTRQQHPEQNQETLWPVTVKEVRDGNVEDPFFPSSGPSLLLSTSQLISYKGPSEINIQCF